MVRLHRGVLYHAGDTAYLCARLVPPRQEKVRRQMKAALNAYRADEQTLCGFADKLIWRMDKVIADMAPDNYQYERTKD